MNDISERLKKLFKGSSARAFAKSIDVSPTTFNEYIKNNRMPSIDVIIKICETHEISYRWLLTGKGEMNDERGVSSEQLELIIRHNLLTALDKHLEENMPDANFKIFVNSYALLLDWKSKGKDFGISEEELVEQIADAVFAADFFGKIFNAQNKKP